MHSFFFRSVIFAGLALAVCFTGCRQSEKKAKKKSNTGSWNKSIQGNFSQQTTTVFDSAKVDLFLEHYPKLDTFAVAIKDFYRRRNYAYAWFEENKLIEPAGNLANRLMNLEDEGVYKKSPYQEQLDSLMNGTISVKGQPNTDLELMLTAQYFMFSKLAWNGLDQSASRSSKWFLPRKKVSYSNYLDSLLKKGTGGEKAEEPVFRQYDLLKNYLKKYNALNKENNWPAINPAVKTKAGDSSAVITLVKSRLYRFEDFKGDTTNKIFDPELTAAIKQYQLRNGLTANGNLNSTTINSLNVSPEQRIKQIIVNMERSRWLPVSIKGDYLGVNIPEYQLHVYHADSLFWSCNVVVGQTVHQTTIFYGEVKYVVFSPYWNVPPGILRNEVLPGIKRNSNYLASHNMEVNGTEDGLPAIRQKPGASNSLGLVKFLFPNSYNIYLHDTPSKSLFGETSRAFSHGCIRVSQPAKLAGFLLSSDSTWTDKKIYKAMHSGKEQYITLKKKVPVFITYFTAFVDRNNRLNFRKDIYSLDDRLAKMIMEGKK